MELQLFAEQMQIHVGVANS